VVIVLANNNQASDQKVVTDYQNKVAAQATELSNKYYTEFNTYSGRPAAFNAADVTSLTTQDLKVGDGAAIGKDSTFSAYYIGWTPDGKVFDSSISSGTLKAPIAVSPGSVIPGWTNGVVGMKVGGVRELAIPADQAYGASGSGAIPANTPLKFIVMIIPTPETIPVPQAVINAYSQQ
jgi:peptidylprolyl isomerase